MAGPKEISRETLKTGNFIKYQHITWEDAEGKERNWEVVERIIGRDAVLIIPWIRPTDELVLVRQYRPPANCYVIEFPAGLVDEGETPEQAAVRELKEEAGYEGSVVRIIDPTFNTPGMSGETVYQVIMDVPAGQRPAPEPDDGEHIELQIVPKEEFEQFVRRELGEGNRFDSKVMTYLLGMISAQYAGGDNWLEQLPGE